jgi:hypothetical protein
MTCAFDCPATLSDEESQTPGQVDECALAYGTLSCIGAHALQTAAVLIDQRSSSVAICASAGTGPGRALTPGLARVVSATANLEEGFTTTMDKIPAVIRGRVSCQGGPCPGALIEAHGPHPNDIMTAVADPRGDYRFDQLSPGTYSLRCSLPGYAPVVQKGIEARHNEVISIDFELHALSSE